MRYFHHLHHHTTYWQSCRGVPSQLSITDFPYIIYCRKSHTLILHTCLSKHPYKYKCNEDCWWWWVTVPARAVSRPRVSGRKRMRSHKVAALDTKHSETRAVLCLSRYLDQNYVCAGMNILIILNLINTMLPIPSIVLHLYWHYWDKQPGSPPASVSLQLALTLQCALLHTDQ